MAYIYLLNLYEKIDFRLNETRAQISNKSNRPEDIGKLEGRIEILSEFRQFLTDTLDQKLPKRIRKKMLKSGQSPD